MKLYDTLISAAELSELLKSGTATVVIDCRFDLADPARGRQDYALAHIPGAHYLHLDDHLCGPKTGRNGRHPLPAREDFAATLAAIGVDRASQVVIHDATDGMYASRAWWMMKWIGHRAAAVLDGGLSAWTAAGGGVTAEVPARSRRGDIAPGASLVASVDFDAVSMASGGGSRIIVDARAPERYRGDVESIDPVGGHIPGAVNRFYKDNLAANGAFKSEIELREDFARILAGRSPAEAIAQCGSGVTACHNLLAMAVAGLEGAALYPGSWSEWCARASQDRFARG